MSISMAREATLLIIVPMRIEANMVFGSTKSAMKMLIITAIVKKIDIISKNTDNALIFIIIQI